MNKKVNEQLKLITDSLVKNYKPEKIILFGSYAYGKPHKDSDLDLLVIKNTKKNMTDRMIEAQMALPRPRKIGVDIIVYTKDEIQNAIREKNVFVNNYLLRGKKIYDKTS